MKKCIAIIISICILLTVLSSCVKEKKDFPNIANDFVEKEKSELAFSSQTSDNVKLSSKTANELLEIIENVKAEYKYADLYELEEVQRRLNYDFSVSEHPLKKLDKENFNIDTLYAVVIENNENFKNEIEYKYETVDQEFVYEICKLIVKTIDVVQEMYPDIDWDRVYCNLSNLKMLYKSGMLAYAQVDEKLILSIGKNNIIIAQSQLGDNGFRNVLVHEIMHIIQVGCVCENLEGTSRRAGISVYWDDFSLNTTDWTWLIEGAADRFASKITGDDATTYRYKVDYICSYNMSILLRDSVNADAIETLTLYDDPELLFDAFGCETQEEREEVLKLLISTEILQTQPILFYDKCAEKTGYNPAISQEEKDKFGYYLKADIGVSLAREFYENLVGFIQYNEVSLNDVFFLINLFEGHLNQHMKFNKEEQKEFNQKFFDKYNILRDEFFKKLAKDNSGKDFATLYDEYNIVNGKNLNADLNMLPELKREFLIERAQWQKDNLALGVKVPAI